MEQEEIGWLRSDFLSEDDARHALAHSLGIPFMTLDRDDISADALMLIPEPLSRTRNVVAFAVSEAGIEVALLDIKDLEAVESLELPHKLLPRLVDQDSMRRALVHYQKVLKEKFGELLKDGKHVVDGLILHALASRAGHVHIDSLTDGALIRYRIKGVLHEAMKLPEHVGRALTSDIKSLAKLFPTALVQEGGFKIEKDNETIHVRVHNTPTASGEKLHLRLAREQHSRGFTLETLGFHGSGLEHMHAALSHHSGLILVCGSEGSGRTTTLYTLLDLLLHPGIALSTIENPVEHRLTNVAQTQVNTETGLTFAAGLRAVLKGDPDVVMVGDIRDRDTAALAASAASRGVLILAGLEAPSAAEGVAKMLRLGLSPLQLASNLRVVVAQHLVRKLCKKHEMQKLSREDSDMFETSANFGHVLAELKEEEIVGKDTPWKDVEFARAVSCEECESGYKNKIGLQEVLSVSAEIKELLTTGAEPEAIENQAREDGMLTIIEDGLFKAAQGQTSMEKVINLLTQ